MATKRPITEKRTYEHKEQAESVKRFADRLNCFNKVELLIVQGEGDKPPLYRVEITGPYDHNMSRILAYSHGLENGWNLHVQAILDAAQRLAKATTAEALAASPVAQANLKSWERAMPSSDPLQGTSFEGATEHEEEDPGDHEN